jgi:hypothetical protein
MLPPPIGGTTPNPTPPLSPSGTDQELRITGFIASGGAAVLALGSLLPWLSVTSLFGTFSVAGTEGDGVITLILGGIAAFALLMSTLNAARPGLLAGAIAAGLGTAVSLYHLVNIGDTLAGVEAESDYVRASVGVGLYLCAGGGVLASVLGMVAWSKSRQPATTLK